MAKRKRLTPLPQAGAVPPDLETKAAYPDGVWRAPAVRAPIAGVTSEAAAVAALDEMGRGLEAARAEGRFLLSLPLDEVDETYLVRDRMTLDPEEMDALVESLRRRGQQTAIEVADLGQGRGPRWGLISGWRRLTALRRIAEETGEPQEVLAAVRQPADAAAAYQAMVEENEIRAGLSHYERARIVVRAAEAGVYADDRAALSDLFAAASRPRRSKIGSFVRVVRALDEVLRFPAAIGERLGLALAQALEADPGLADRIAQEMRAARPDSAARETALIAAAIRAPSRPASPAPAPGPAPALAYDARHRRITIEGEAVADPDFRRALEAWLAEGGWQRS